MTAGLGRLATLAPFGVGVVVLVLLAPSLMPGVGFWDTAEFQTAPPVLGTMHPTGYPTYVLLGFVANLLLAPIGEPAFRMNAMSLLCVAFAAGVTVHLARRLTGWTAIAIAAGLGMALTPITWRIATLADAHALHLAFVALLVTLLVHWEDAHGAGRPGADRWLVAAAVTFGLSAGNHSLTLLLAIPVGLYVLAVDPRIIRRPRLVVGCLAALLGPLALVYLELPVRSGMVPAPLVYASPNTWDGFWYIALAEQFRGSFGDPLSDLGRKASELWAFAGAQLGAFAAVAPIGFLAMVGRQPRLALLTGSAMLVTLVFNLSYSNADIERYYLGPALFAWLWLAVLFGVIVDQVAGSGSNGRRAILPGAMSVVLSVALLVPTGLAYPARTSLLDRSSDTSADRWLDAALDEIEADAVVISWWAYSTPLWYAQYVEGRRPDILVVDDRTRLDRDFGEVPDVIERFLGARPVYVMRVGNEIGPIMRLYDLVRLTAPADNVYLVTGRKDPA